MRQGTFPSALLYSIFVNELLLKQLSTSGFGSLAIFFCGAGMHADDLALISGSALELQSMLNTVDSTALCGAIPSIHGNLPSLSLEKHRHFGDVMLLVN